MSRNSNPCHFEAAQEVDSIRNGEDGVLSVSGESRAAGILYQVLWLAPAHMYNRAILAIRIIKN
jgi:hypothetical protein